MELARLTDLHQIEDLVVRMFIAADQRNWSNVSDSFTDVIKVDYSSMNGVPSAQMPKEELVSSWQKFLPRFKYTHHQLGNFQVAINDDDEADLSCYVSAHHYYSDATATGIWLVIGTYVIKVVRQHTDWKIQHLRFDLKFEDASPDLTKLLRQ